MTPGIWSRELAASRERAPLPRLLCDRALLGGERPHGPQAQPRVLSQGSGLPLRGCLLPQTGETKEKFLICKHFTKIRCANRHAIISYEVRTYFRNDYRRLLDKLVLCLHKYLPTSQVIW